MYLFSIRRYESRSLSFRKDIFYQDHRRKKQRKNGKKSTNRLETTRRRTIHFAQLITTNVIAICARGRGKRRGPWMDDSSIIPPDANGVDVPEIAGILRLNSRHQMNPPPPALHQRSRSRASLRAKRTRASHRERNRLRHAGRSPLTEFLISNLNRQRSLLGYTIETLQFQTSLYRVGLRNQLAR